MTQHIKLGYWGIRGAAQVSRLLLAYTGAKWENVAYNDPNKWFGDDKVNLGFDFPNLPYLIDGDLKISESTAIQRYIIERSENKQLLGKNLHDSAKVNQVLGALFDVRRSFIQLFWDKNYESRLKQVWQKNKAKFEYFEKFFGNKDWAIGYVTLIDFYVSEFSHYFQKVYPEEYKQHPSFQRIRENFNNLQQIKAYYSQPDSMKGPFVPPQLSAIPL